MPTALLRAQSDERLARLAALGNERAFEAIVERYRRPLIGYARRLVGDSRAEDVVQAAFVNAWARMSDGVEVRELRAWLFRIVHNGAVNQLKRASSSDVELLDNAAEPRVLEDDVERRETMRAALGEIAQLPEPQRIALIGSVVQGRRNREIGDELGVTEGAVKMLVHRARSSVRAAAAAFIPFPLLVKLTGSSAGAGAASTAGGTSAGAGASLLGGTALKAAAVVACAGVVGTAGPTIVQHAVSSKDASAGAQAAAPRSAGAGALHAPATAGSLARAAATRPAHHARRPARRPQRTIHREAPTVVAAVPAPEPVAPAPVGAPEPPAATEEHDSSTALPDRRFITKAEVDDDVIDVPEDPADPSQGEQPIPKSGVPDTIAEGIKMDTPDQPDDAADQPDTPDNPSADPADLAAAPVTP